MIEVVFEMEKNEIMLNKIFEIWRLIFVYGIVIYGRSLR